MCTYDRPSTKTPITATFAGVGIFNPKKIQKGSATTAISVKIVMLEIMM